MSLTETAWVPPPPMLGVSSSTMRGGAVGPSSSCVHHVAGGAGKEEDGRRMRKEGSGAVRRRGVEERIGDQRRVICVMLRLIFGSVVDCRDAWHQLLRCAARSVVNTGSKDRGMGYGGLVRYVRPWSVPPPLPCPERASCSPGQCHRRPRRPTWFSSKGAPANRRCPPPSIATKASTPAECIEERGKYTNVTVRMGRGRAIRMGYTRCGLGGRRCRGCGTLPSSSSSETPPPVDPKGPSSSSSILTAPVGNDLGQ